MSKLYLPLLAQVFGKWIVSGCLLYADLTLCVDAVGVVSLPLDEVTDRLGKSIRCGYFRDVDVPLRILDTQIKARRTLVEKRCAELLIDFLPFRSCTVHCIIIHST